MFLSAWKNIYEILRFVSESFSNVRVSIHGKKEKETYFKEKSK